MKKFSYRVLMGLFALIGCQQPEAGEPESQAAGEYTATVIYQLPADGCSWHLRIQQGEASRLFAATEASEKKLVDFVEKNGLGPDGTSRTPVVVNLHPTSRKRDIICGWGSKQTLDEAEVLSIRAK